ncbi:hypothetical protein L1785_14510 [Antribacter sp. KLBMP9083]|uniref:Uncharacterized protein n=1 Tax=Antribacter soli TaxID=2910976 RepID=A0AA41U894_9MICO|nr:hypothetical protein [Antribacter soli]MCF4122190.1 hypothetical protein [Antribacter soli]
MVTMSLFFVLLVAVVVGVWLKKLSNGSLILGILFGLSLAATSFGAPVLDAFQSLLNGLVSGVASVAGA